MFPDSRHILICLPFLVAAASAAVVVVVVAVAAAVMPLSAVNTQPFHGKLWRLEATGCVLYSQRFLPPSLSLSPTPTPTPSGVTALEGNGWLSG